MPRSIGMIHLFAGARSDVAIRCSCDDPPCAATFKSKDTGIWDNRLETYEGDVFELMIDGNPVSSPALLPVVVNRPCYLADVAIRCSCDDPPCAATFKSKDTGIWD